MQQKTLNFVKGPVLIEEEVVVPKQLPWIEKYRPNKIEDLSHQEEVVKAMQGILLTGNLPHLLLHGPPGTGKTSAIIALAKQLYGHDFWKKRVLELNASDDRGIQVVRTKVKKFAEQMNAKNPNKEFLCPTYKIIILDEADSMTQDAQGALRRIIEDYSTDTRFCIICNYITKIIEPLSSRCVKYRFKGIPQEQQIQRLEHICESEHLEAEPDSLQELYRQSGGDLRKSINMLQSASTLYEKRISVKCILEISAAVPADVIEDLLTIAQTSDLQLVRPTVDQVIRLGYNMEQIITQFTIQLIKSPYIKELHKAKILEYAATSEKCMIEGSSEDIQLLNLISQSQRIINS